MREAISSGLTRAAGLPLGAGYVELTAGLSNLGGYARGEVGKHFSPTATGFGFAQGNTSGQWMAGLGYRRTF